MIDALVGIMIFAFGVIGVVGLQATMTRAQTSSKIRADASQLAQELVGIMWTDSPANIARYGNSSCQDHPPCKSWSDKVLASLPSGAANVAVTLVPLPAGSPAGTVIADVDVSLTWSLPGEGTHTVQTSTRVQP